MSLDSLLFVVFAEVVMVVPVVPFSLQISSFP
jgi:hypothetical protein